VTVTVTNLLQGPADVWTGVVGVTEPISNADLGLAVVTSFAEATLANLRVALNQAVAVATKIEVDPTIKNASPTYAAVMLRGKAPGGTGRTVILRRALSTENVALAHTKGDKTVIPVTFTGFYVSASVKPIVIDDTP
jgi:hypothetical protein